MVHRLTCGMTGKLKQRIGMKTRMYKHGETSILQQIQHSWLCGQHWSKPSLLLTKVATAIGFQTGLVLFLFGKSVQNGNDLKIIP